jgi:hypothetical protein
MLGMITENTSAAFHGSFGASATCYRRTENVRVIAVIITPQHTAADISG